MPLDRVIEGSNSMPSNMPILYQNIMDGLPSEFARKMFLWAADKFPNDRYTYKAEAFAREADWLIPTVQGIIELQNLLAHREGQHVLDNEQKADLLSFFQVRHANWRMGGNVKSAPPSVIDAELEGVTQ